MAECSICSRGDEIARVVNELLEKKTPVREIQAQTGIHKNTVHRHQHGHCRFSFSRYKATKVKAKSSIVNFDGREVVSWPNGTFTVHGKPIREENLLPDDLLIRVTYESTPIRLLGNPRAVPFDDRTAESFFDAALAEDAERVAKIDCPGSSTIA